MAGMERQSRSMLEQREMISVMSLLTASETSGDDPKDDDDDDEDENANDVDEGREDDMYSRRSSLSNSSRVLNSNLLELW